MSQSLDLSFERVIGDVSSHEAETLRTLPRRLGISSSQSGGWDDYSKLEPMRNLPLFAVELCPGISDGRVDSFVLAHRAAGFAGLVIDRILDGQAPMDEILLHCAHFLVDRWIDLLTLATEAPREAVSRSVSQSLERLSSASEEERRYVEQGLEGADVYANVVSDKTDWLALATRWMLHLHADESAELAFDRCFESLLLALQLMDDALDDDEDRDRSGRSVSDCLDLESESLLIASERILIETVAESRIAGLGRLSEFCASHAAALHRIPKQGAPTAALGAVFFLAEIVGRESLRRSHTNDRAIIGACAPGFDSTTGRVFSSGWYWPALS